ncbi:MAG: hypothetical protein ACD_19C00011G0001 [uncultured bacterium]|nr:MAG: hypothetical protein ACD_19C00011G0001 [uncultured bacterium]
MSDKNMVTEVQFTNELTPAQQTILLCSEQQSRYLMDTGDYNDCYSDNYDDSDGYRDGGEWS